MKAKLNFSILLTLFFPLFLMGQNASLADHYFKNGEYEKALSIYEELYEKNNNSYYFSKVIDIYKELGDYDKAAASLKKNLDKNPTAIDLYVLLGEVEELRGNQKEAKNYYKTAINKLPANRGIISMVANAFSRSGKYAETIEVMEKGGKLLKDEKIFSYSLAEFYRREGDKEKMVKNYLLALEENTSRLNSIKTMMSRYLDEDDLTIVQTYIYERISDGDSNPVFSELLSWVAIQREDYMMAFRQLRALDIRLGENGTRVYSLGNIARNAGDYKTALMAFDYIIENKEQHTSYYIPAHMSKLNTQIMIVNKEIDNSEMKLQQIDLAYDSLLMKLGENHNTVHLMLDQAEFNAFQIGNVEKSVEILNRVNNMRTVNPRVRAVAKLQLADFMLIRGEKWDATLLYSQVDKDFPEDELGEQARFKNAMLSYYTGDYEWAKDQFDILKAATSRFYSNDAIDMSVFIAENLNLDTTAVPLQMYAEAEFLLFQNRQTEAMQQLEKLLDMFPDHSLEDDIIYLKGKIYQSQEKYDLAIVEYNKVVELFADEIRADNALYELALIYDEILNDEAMAMEMYERLFMDYQGSTFAVYARKRYRELKGKIF